MSTNISIVSEIGKCSEFLDCDGKMQEISIVISPLKVLINDNSTKMRVITGCNMWKSCYNIKCYYSVNSLISNKSDNKKAQKG